MRTILLACDDDAIAAEVDAALVDDGTRLAQVTAGHDVIEAVRTVDPDLVILDMQIGNMGGLAACRHLRLESGAGRIPSQRIVLLLDRAADSLLAEQSGADARLVKPLDALRLQDVVADVLGDRPVDA
ncbi:MAG: response regulator [Acidobacteria bacterium]|nr:response regulator [Acidobacteriota bacterium]